MPEASLPAGLSNLLRQSAYPHPVTGVRLIQTHISYVFLTDADVYKVKKSLNLGFLDFSTLEARRIACEREVALNRRLCAEAYLGVVPLVESGDGLVVGRETEAARAVEWAVHMCRMPEERFLHERLRRGTMPADSPARIAALLARFHASAPTSGEIARYGMAEEVEAHWRENLEQARPFIGATISAASFAEIEAFAMRTLGDEASLFAERAAAGRVRDGHGDLRAESVYLHDADICIMDCIEFNDRFRYVDVASELSFLLMDVERLGYSDVADEIAGRYLSLAYDETLPLLLPFYKCLRAFIRGKVRSIEANEPDVPDEQRREAAEAARRTFDLALSYTRLRFSRQTLVVMSGRVGSGKSYVATALAARLGAALIRSDVVRKELAGIFPGTAVRSGELNARLYSPDNTARTFDELFRRAETRLAGGHSVVLDATFGDTATRSRARDLAARSGVRCLLVECAAPEATIRERLLAREHEEGQPSDATLDVAERLRQSFQDIDPATEGPHMLLDTTAALPALLRSIESALAP